MEARRIGHYELANSSVSNYVVFKFEVVKKNVVEQDFTQYEAVFEDRGWNMTDGLTSLE